MPVRLEPWPTGTPAWVDLMVPDLDTARRFYSALFGWELTGQGDPATEMVYITATKAGSAAAGIGSVPPGEVPPPARWTTYLATSDIEATTAAAADAGATVLVPPTTAEQSGRFALLADPAGAVVGLWQSGTHTGADITDEAGSMTWNETMSRDVEAAQTFYATVFGYTYTDMSAPGFVYASFAVDGRTAGGIGQITDDTGEQLDPHWLVYFKVDDVDDALHTVTAMGGTVARHAWDSPFGRIALVDGPAGERFAIMADLVGQPAVDMDEAATA